MYICTSVNPPIVRLVNYTKICPLRGYRTGIICFVRSSLGYHHMRLRRSIHTLRRRSPSRVLFSMTLAMAALSSEVISFAADKVFHFGLILLNVGVWLHRILELLVPIGVRPEVLLEFSLQLRLLLNYIQFRLKFHREWFFFSVSTFFLNTKRYKKII